MSEKFSEKLLALVQGIQSKYSATDYFLMQKGKPVIHYSDNSITITIKGYRAVYYKKDGGQDLFVQDISGDYKSIPFHLSLYDYIYSEIYWGLLELMATNTYVNTTGRTSTYKFTACIRPNVPNLNSWMVGCPEVDIDDGVVTHCWNVEASSLEEALASVIDKMTTLLNHDSNWRLDDEFLIDNEYVQWDSGILDDFSDAPRKVILGYL